MAKDKKVEALRRVPLFSGCSDRELKSIASITDRIELDDGALLMEEGSTGRDLWILAEGNARVSRNGRTLRTATPGDALGELALLDGETRSATVAARGPVVAYVVGGRSFTNMLKDAPSVGLRIMQGMAARLRDAEARPRRR